jgi:chorismate dehydratase
MSLRLGVSPYINGLVPDYGFNLPGVQKVYEVPSELCNRLRAGELDISFVSSVEYFRHSELYFILPDICVCSHAEVDSVGVFSRYSKSDWRGKKFLLSPDSETSNALFRIICCNYLQIEVDLCVPQAVKARLSDYLNLESELDGFVSIGDLTQILKERKKDWFFYDMGRLWMDFTGLESFVFGLWLVRRDFAVQNSALVSGVYRALRSSIYNGLENIDNIYHSGRFGLNREKFREFLKERLGYELGSEQKKALQIFGRALTSTVKDPDLAFFCELSNAPG